jgi:cytoskeleton protein RodZ
MAKGNFGERLKREREMRDVTVEELTKGTRIGPRFLDALENEQWDKLPGGVFGRGFVRSIARYLGLDEESLLSEYDLARGEQKHEAPAPYENRLPSPPKWIPVLAVLVLLLVLAGFFYAGRYVWHKYEAHRATKQTSAILRPGEQSADALRAFPTKSADSATAPLSLTVSTSVTTRVRVLADHQVVLDAEIAVGDTWHFPANEQFEVTAANSSAVFLELNGQAMPPSGARGSPGTIVLGLKDLRQASSGSSQP